MILLIDNYDSFSYNVYQLVSSVVSDVKVIRNDDCTVEEIEDMHPQAIIFPHHVVHSGHFSHSHSIQAIQAIYQR